jgi:hypothetical protein
MKVSNNILVLGIVVLIIALLFLSYKINFEHFANEDVIETHVETNPEFDLRDQASIVSGDQSGLEVNNSNNNNNNNEDSSMRNTTRDYVRKTDIERAARASAREYCPVSPDYNPSDFIRKSEIDFQAQCPKMPDLKDYLLKSTIPPVQKCPSCVCPKVKVSAGMCQKCPEPKNNCPKPQPCGVEQCKDVIKCASNEKQVSCPKCPAPQPCPKPVEKVCPAFEIPKNNVKCPPPQPCPMPTPCPNVEGRCPEQKETTCKYYGVKDVVHEKSVDQVVNELLLSNDPKLKELLNNLKSKLDLNLSSAPTEMVNNNVTTLPAIEASVTTASTNMELEEEEAMPEEEYSFNVPKTPLTNSLPQNRYNNNTEYELNQYKYSIYNNGMYAPQPTLSSGIQSNLLNDANEANNRVCDVNDTNCPYNTNINM